MKTHYTTKNQLISSMERQLAMCRHMVTYSFHKIMPVKILITPLDTIYKNWMAIKLVLKAKVLGTDWWFILIIMMLQLNRETIKKKN